MARKCRVTGEVTPQNPVLVANQNWLNDALAVGDEEDFDDDHWGWCEACDTEVDWDDHPIEIYCGQHDFSYHDECKFCKDS